MPKKISSRTEWKAIDLILKGWSFDRVSEKVGLSKGWTMSLWGRVCAGAYPDLVGAGETLEGLREIAVEMRRQGGSVAQGLLGAMVLRRLAALGITPDTLSHAADLIERMRTPEFRTDEFGPAVVRLLRLEQREGRHASEIVKDLEARTAKRAEIEALTKKATSKLEGTNKDVESALRNAKVTREGIHEVLELNRRLKAQGLDIEDGERGASFLAECKRLGYDADRVRSLSRLDEALRRADLDVPRAIGLLGQWDDVVKLGYSVESLRDLCALWTRAGLDPVRGLALVHEATVNAADLDGIVQRRRKEVEASEEALRRADAALDGLREERSRLVAEVGKRQDEVAELVRRRDETEGGIRQLTGEATDLEARLARLMETEDLAEGMRRFVEDLRSRAKAVAADLEGMQLERDSCRKEIEALGAEANLVRGVIALLFTERDRLPAVFARDLRDLALLVEGGVPAGSPLEHMGFRGTGPSLESEVRRLRGEIRDRSLPVAIRIAREEYVLRATYDSAERMLKHAIAGQDRADAQVRELQEKVRTLEYELTMASCR